MGREQLESSVWIYCLTFIYFHKTHTHAHTDPHTHGNMESKAMSL